MRFTKAILTCFAAASLALFPATAMAQDSGNSGQEERKPEQNWLKVCDTLESGEEACVMRQTILQGGQFSGAFLLRDDPTQDYRLLAIAAVPIGVFLPAGLTLQIDNAKPISLPYVICDPQSCMTQLAVNEAYVNSLKKGARLVMTAKNRQNKDLKIEVNLSGFTAVYEGDATVTAEELRDQQTGQSALEQMLQQQAEKIRQEKEGAGESTDAGQ